MDEVKQGERLKMRHWLKKAIDSGEYNGVEWTDKQEGKFRVPWKHASINGWDMDRDAGIFKMWAVYTGKFSNEIRGLSMKEKRAYAKYWKANFRCALNALQDIEVVRKEGKSKGKDAYKVFRLLPQLRAKSKVTKMRLSSTGSLDEKERYRSRKPSKATSRQVQQQKIQNASDSLMDHTYSHGSQPFMFNLGNDNAYQQIKKEDQSSYLMDYQPWHVTSPNGSDGCYHDSGNSSCGSESELSEASKLIELLSTEVANVTDASSGSTHGYNDQSAAVSTELVNNSPGFLYENDFFFNDSPSEFSYLKNDPSFFTGCESQGQAIPF